MNEPIYLFDKKETMHGGSSPKLPTPTATTSATPTGGTAAAKAR